jgi:hypothetical protein
VGLIVFESYRSFVPSEELKELRIASKELKELQTTVKPVVDLATARYPNVDTSEALAFLIERVKALEEQMTTVEREREAMQKNQQQHELLRRTAPEVDARLVRSVKGEYVVVIQAKNLVPFFARWLIVTKKDHVVSGIMMGEEKLHPTPNQMLWRYRMNVKTDEIEDNFVELRFRFKSVFSAEMGNPTYLKGKMVRAYNLLDGTPYLKEVK